MKRISAIFTILLFLVACSAESETVEVTRLVEVTVEVTRVVEVPVEVTRIVEITPKSTTTPQKPGLSDIDIEQLLVEEGDLPAVISAGQVSDNLPDLFDIYIGDNNPTKVVARELHNDALDMSGDVYVMLFESIDDAVSQYEGFVNFIDNERDFSGAKNVDSVGDQAFGGDDLAGIFSDSGSYYINYATFIRCNSVVYIVIRVGSRDRAIAYAIKLDARLAPLVCD